MLGALRWTVGRGGPQVEALGTPRTFIQRAEDSRLARGGAFSSTRHNSVSDWMRFNSARLQFPKGQPVTTADVAPHA
jgi:hypothetical protein